LYKAIKFTRILTVGGILAGIGLYGTAANASEPLLTPPVLPGDTALVDVASVIPEAPRLEQRTLKVRRGDTLMKMLVGAGFDRSDAHSAITALREVYDPRKLKPGQTITVKLDPATAKTPVLLGLALDPDVDRNVSVNRSEDMKAFSAAEVRKALVEKPVRVDGDIQSSLYEAAVAGGMPPSVLIELIHAMSFDVDFQRDIQPGDSFKVMFSRFHDEVTGAALRNGDISHARFTLSGKELRIYRFKDKSGRVDFFDEKGNSVRKALLKTPVDGARISSRYGKRRHPILGYTKMHRGVDFAAPRGTPIYAAGDGVVEASGWNGGYGRYVRIRHNGEYKTAYAHMKGIAKAARKGKRVRQGDIIGWVGTTGRSTGPHLHYEVLRGSRQVNPLSIKLPTGKKLTGTELAKFLDLRREIDREFDSLPTFEPIAPTVASAN
jgi:murein DD-endopeptidase MepM/ murein hydrolase activator NlpD